MYLRNFVKMKHHMSYFYNALLEYYPLGQACYETYTSSLQVQRKQIDSHKVYAQNVYHWHEHKHAACWPLVNCVINQRLLQASPHMQQTLLQLINVMKSDSDVILQYL